MSDFVVPVDEMVESFHRHLTRSPRTILSSKFGDGKSYFIHKLRENKELSKDYEFLTIYPVNYQVVGNKDIFEIIKRDVLFQLMFHDMVCESIELTEAEKYAWALFFKGGTVIMDLIQYLPAIGFGAEQSNKAILATNGLKLFSHLKDELDQLKLDYKSDGELIDEFLSKVDQSTIYDYDVITEIINKSIKNYQDTTGKKVVLFIEDLDRLDPAHLFRILNVLSAHIDFCYKYSVEPDSSLVGNKFGLDNIVLVIDYRNLRNIFGHFYGRNTDFDGYISKFLSCPPFHYSLEGMRHDYVINAISKITNLDYTFLCSIFTRDLIVSNTMRDLVSSISSKQVDIEVPVVTCGGVNVQLCPSFLYLMSILRHLKWDNDEIRLFIEGIKQSHLSMFVRYVLPYIFVSGGDTGPTRIVVLADDNHEIYRTQIILDVASGTVTIGSKWYKQENDKEINISDTIDTMLGFIS